MLNWGCLIDNGVGLNKDGSLIAGWVHKGADLDSSPDARLNWVSDHVNKALSRLSGGWAIWCDAIRLPAPKYFDPADSRFPDPVSQLIEDERRAHFLSGDRHYETEYALLIQYMPPIKSKGMLVNLVYDDHGTDPQSPGDIALAAFKRVLTEMEDALSGALDMQRMHDYSAADRAGQVQRRSHLVNYLHFCLTGQEVHLNLPPGEFYLNSVIGGQDFYPGDTPLVGETYVAVVAIPGILRLRLRACCRCSTSSRGRCATLHASYLSTRPRPGSRSSLWNGSGSSACAASGPMCSKFRRHALTKMRSR